MIILLSSQLFINMMMVFVCVGGGLCGIGVDVDAGHHGIGVEAGVRGGGREDGGLRRCSRFYGV